MPEPTLDDAIAYLKQQGVEVVCELPRRDGIICKLLGYHLTDLQVLKLMEYGRLNPEGIRAFSQSIKREEFRLTAMPLPEHI